MPKFKVYITRKIPDNGIKMLKAQGYQVKMNPLDRVLTKKELIKNVKGIDALLSLLTDKVDAEVLDAAGKNLKIVANFAVGFDNLDVEAAKKRGVMLTNTPQGSTESVAEHTMGLLLASARRVVEADKFTRAGKYKGWKPFLFIGEDIHDKTLGIIGLGRIGFAVAARAIGFGLKIVYHDVKRNPEFETKYGAQYLEVPELLKQSDFVSLHVPLLPSTRHLISKKEFGQMKKTAYLINTSRGPVIDEKALVTALKKKQIAGAAIDVYEFEPKMAPGLNKLDNIILTPHIASATIETRKKMSEIAATNIIAVLNGQTPIGTLK
ncbi:MAG: hypothetical protein ACD_72C00075G0003 [uncultured bacterium]|nr:MAG: hypothetical protein ACD_72C00075G0003 [uncultured bacterium]